MKWQDFLPKADQIVSSYREQAPEGYDPKNTWVAVAVVAAGAIAAGASGYAASSAASSAADAQAQQLGLTTADQQLKLLMYNQSRGEGGSALLPVYDTRNGQPIEPQLAQDLTQAYDVAGTMTPQQQYDAALAIQAGLAPMQAQSNATAAGIFNGQLTAEEQANQAPVAEARQGAVEGRTSAALTALNKTISEINAIQSRKGYVGDSFATNTLRNKARLDIANQTSGDQGSVNIANATDRASIANAGVKRRVDNLSLPNNLARNNIDYLNLPANSVMDQAARRVQLPLQLRLAPSSVAYTPIPQIQPIASTGQILGQAAGSVASAAGNYFTAQQLAAQQQANTQANIKAYADATRAQQVPVQYPVNFGQTVGSGGQTVPSNVPVTSVDADYWGGF